MSREVMQLALDALVIASRSYQPIGVQSMTDPAIEALRSELAKPDPEPVAWMWRYIGRDKYPTIIGNGLIARSKNEMDPEDPPFPKTWKLEYSLYRKEDL